MSEKRFFPVGADKESQSDFLLICGTNRDLGGDVRAGRFREDLLTRINLWSFRLPSLAERRSDIELNLDDELTQVGRATGRQIHFNREARARYLAFSLSPGAGWHGNFRDLNASVRRMATMAPTGRITAEVVDEENARLRASWVGLAAGDEFALVRSMLGADGVEKHDRFDLAQLEAVLEVCRSCSSLSDAGRRLFAASRDARASTTPIDCASIWPDSHSIGRRSVAEMRRSGPGPVNPTDEAA